MIWLNSNQIKSLDAMFGNADPDEGITIRRFDKDPIHGIHIEGGGGINADGVLISDEVTASGKGVLGISWEALNNLT